MPDQDAMLIVKEIYDCTISHEIFEEQLNWQEISDVIDDFQYGNNLNGFTRDMVNEMIIAHARRLWHTKVSKITFKELIGHDGWTLTDEENFYMFSMHGGSIV